MPPPVTTAIMPSTLESFEVSISSATRSVDEVKDCSLYVQVYIALHARTHLVTTHKHLIPA